MEILSACDYVRKIKKVSKEEMQVEVQIPEILTTEYTGKTIDFLIIIGANFPLAAPRVFSKTSVK